MFKRILTKKSIDRLMNDIPSKEAAQDLQQQIMEDLLNWQPPPIEQTISQQMSKMNDDKEQMGVEKKDKLIGTKVKISGIAQNAFLGAVVLDEMRMPYYIENLDEWEDDIFGKRITVHGILMEKKLAPDPEVGPNGEVSHGKFGTDHVLGGCEWVIDES